MRVLVVNAGSSSLKLRVLGFDDEIAFSRDLPPMEDRFLLGSPAISTNFPPQNRALEDALSETRRVDAVGHRIVHGGTRFSESVAIDETVKRQLRALVELAPQHQPHSLAALEAVSRALPDVPAVACFDTAFHASLPPGAATYAIPAPWRESFGVRRYGFHGLSHSYAARRAAKMLGRPIQELRIVTCHLGAGASLAAVRDGVSVDTTMGFTPLEGLVMATRSGTVDPGLVLWLQRRVGLSADEVGQALEHDSGLTGLAGTADMRKVLNAAEAGETQARTALDIYVHRLVGSIAAMAASAGGIDTLVFTGGVGENAWQIREMAAERLAFLGVAIDPERNRSEAPDAEVGQSSAAVRSLVIASREDLEVAREVRLVLA